MPSTIFAGSKVKTLKSTLSLNGGADIISSTTNPQTSAVSAEPGSLLLNTTSGIMYRKLDAGSTTNWVEVGTGSGGKNYIKNSDFDGGATTSWSMQKVSLSSLVPTGNIGAPDAGHTIATSSSSPLEGANSLLVQGASAFTAGNCLVSEAFAIDREDQAKVMGWSFYYEAVTSNMDFSGTSSGTWAVYIAEVTTATPDTVVSWIQPAGVYNLVQSSGAGIASGTFQTTATGTAYRLVLVCINNEAAATTLKVDDFQLGPQKMLAGAAISDWVSYTPTFNSGFSVGTGGFATNNWKYRRVGDSIEVKGRVVFGTAGNSMGSGNFTVSIPPELSIDINKLDTVASGNTYGSAGVAWAYDSGGTAQREVYYVTRSDTSLTSVQVEGRTDAGVTAAWTSAFPFTWGSTDTLVIIFTLPISGWSSNTVMSQDTDTRVVALRATMTSGGPYATPAVFLFNSISDATRGEVDTHAAYNTSTGVYTVPVSGIYQIDVSLWSGSGGTYLVRLENAAGTVEYGRFFQNNSGIAAANISVAGSITQQFKAGDTFRVTQSFGTATWGADANNTRLSVRRLSGPATIAASETVGFKAKTTTTSVANEATQVMVFSDIVYSTHGAYSSSTGVFTAPVSGKYQCNGAISISYIANQDVAGGLAFFKNNVQQSWAGTTKFLVGGDAIVGSTISDVIQLNAGDTLDLRCYQKNPSLVSRSPFNGVVNYFSVMRVGN